ncbi:MAG: preprotein translocase subunit YajC [Gammaproteobacteria bacterium]|nr:preprotein translocase subunit YajC [Gammaproteobacteria bacterium]MCD8525309.1 preprotein translocase subunit YajC [Gammaproteobacteria bacterium]MCD8543279.1 preprotein translocase subunit YajC [Gammaproteobacteria bacterium]
MIRSKILFALSAALIPAFVFAEGEAAAATQQGGFGPIIFLVAILAFMYLLVWRPQQKKAKEHRALVAGVGVDDEVLLSSGIVGKVSSTYDQYVAVTLADNVTVMVQRVAVTAVLPKGTIDALKSTK